MQVDTNIMKWRLSEMKMWDNVVVPSFFIGATIVLITLNLNSGFAIEYSNYTSTKYKIQFQYPSDWNVTEKTGRFDEGLDLKIANPMSTNERILIMYLDATVADQMSTAGIAAVVNVMVDETRNDFSKEIRIIEDPTFLSINGKQAGTFLYTSKDKYDTEALTWGQQIWTVNLVTHGYFITFMATPDRFDSPENIQIRDQFIKSIKFLQ